MEAENKLYADVHGNGQGQPPPNPPQYTPTPPQQPGPPQGYPPNMASAPYYAPPSGAIPGGGYGAPPYGQQQQQVTVIAAHQPAPVIYVAESFSGAVIYSCLVLWFCNFCFGLAGYILAVMARDTAISDSQQARKLGRASYIVSTVGIIVSVIVGAVLLGVVYGGVYCVGYKVDGECYRYRSSLSYDTCSLMDGVYRDGYCYYN